MKRKTGGLTTFLIITIILITYIHQMSPSPILSLLGEEYGILGNDALLNLSISIIFPMLIIGSIVGGMLERKIGTKTLLTLTLVFCSLGFLVNYVAFNYTVFLVGRMIYGIGFGLGVPFIGSAIMKWYDGKMRDIMTTVNGLFPFFGTVISFLAMGSIYHFFKDDSKAAFGVWGIVLLVLAILWVFMVKEPDEAEDDAEKTNESSRNTYAVLLKNKSIILLCVIFICDFSCYSYIATVLPTLLLEAGSMSETVANLWAAIAFPASGILGCSLGGLICSKTGKRKPALVFGQLFKFVGIAVMVFASGLGMPGLILGAGIFGFANGFWMPSFYGIPTELENMDSGLVASAFSLMSSFGFAMGFVIPIVGGALTNYLEAIAVGSVSGHVFGLLWSTFIFGLLNLIALVAALIIKESGKGRLSKGEKINDGK